MKNKVQEYNFDGIVGPTHNYSGLSRGNIASINNKNTISNPKAAALQGLEKMKVLYDLGLGQAVLPPQPRPDIEFLKKLGFSGSIENILKSAYQYSPRLFYSSYSASAMWAANAATITASIDSSNSKLHITPANLVSNTHRMLESNNTYIVFNKIFSDQNYFSVHEPLPGCEALGDEGAANHTRFCGEYSNKGVYLFVYGQEYYNISNKKPSKYPARQTLEASQSIARQHGLDNNNTIFIQQNPNAIDHGVFHNDVCAVGNKNLLLCYESAYVDQENNLNKLKKLCKKNDIDINIYQVFQKELSYQDMVKSYLFNSQILETKDNKTFILAPIECQENRSANQVLNNIIQDTNNQISDIKYIDCRQSMRNGGGPACLRLRIVLSEEEVSAIEKNSNIILTDNLYNKLVGWVNKYYRDELAPSDLLDSSLYQESYAALDELTRILKLGDIYFFQK